MKPDETLNNAYNVEFIAENVIQVIEHNYCELSKAERAYIKELVSAHICEPSVIADTLSQSYDVPRDDIFKVC